MFYNNILSQYSFKDILKQSDQNYFWFIEDINKKYLYTEFCKVDLKNNEFETGKYDPYYDYISHDNLEHDITKYSSWGITNNKELNKDYFEMTCNKNGIISYICGDIKDTCTFILRDNMTNKEYPLDKDNNENLRLSEAYIYKKGYIDFKMNTNEQVLKLEGFIIGLRSELIIDKENNKKVELVFYGYIQNRANLPLVIPEFSVKITPNFYLSCALKIQSELYYESNDPNNESMKGITIPTNATLDIAFKHKKNSVNNIKNLILDLFH